MKQGKTSVRTIAEHLGISAITVTRVLSGYPSVSLETRNRVLDEVKRVGYNYGAHSKIIKRERSRNVVIHCPETKMWSDRLFAFYSDLYYRCVKRFHAEVIRSDLVDFNENPESGLPALEEAGGLAILGPIEPNIFRKIKETYPRLAMVSYCGNQSDVTQIGCSDFTGGEIAAEKIYEYGHRSAVLLTTLEEESIRKRAGGFWTKFQSLGGRVAFLPYRESGNVAGDDGARTEILDNYLRKNRNDASVFFCSGGYLAQFLYRYFAERGIKVPDDFSVVTYDNFALFDVMVPPLARVCFNVKDLAFQIVENLKNQMQFGSAGKISVEIMPEFVDNPSLALRNNHSERKNV